VRCALEALSFESGSVLTLTYDPGRMARKDGSLNPPELTAFLKSLRQLIDVPIRFFAVGEYGEHGPGHHPHFHVLVFGYDFPDRYFARLSRKGTRLYGSDLLDRAWKHGFGLIDPRLSWDSAQYVAGYCMKKINGEAAVDHYRGLEKEFIRTSLKPGIGRAYFDAHYRELYERGFVSFPDDDREFYLPRKFDQWFSEIDPDGWEVVKAKRAKERAERESDSDVVS
jgi:hypothetical protein